MFEVISLFCTIDLSEEPLFSSNLVVVSTPGDFFLNISIVANPFVIPANITVQNPPGVTLPAFSVIQIGDRGTAYIKLDQFQLPKYAGSYVITLRHPAVSAAVIQFNLTVRCKFFWVVYGKFVPQTLDNTPLTHCVPKIVPTYRCTQICLLTYELKHNS